MSRHEIVFTIHHNRYFESYLCTFWGRVDRVITFGQLLLGTIIFAQVSGTFIYGALVTVLSLFAVVYSPAEKAIKADNQTGKYAQLIALSETMSDEELIEKSNELGLTDSDPIGLFYGPSHLRAAIRLDLDTNYVRPLTRLEKIFAWIGGDLPRP
ncbi:hypothetical protein [Vibrio porteresiae]|uniref:Uncharacterized protein n=1 Tax=Vibrio porteresiae DSM 19223 TaxID=1123496 RepID=A0ABZ0QBJ3_9VIBR|nr:hypothetical protein [Vibrio porteresiae]WPC72950.1 hypothetical protein R8Z52_12530 [Vibrio porteresiae DSM 19223]